MQGYARIYADDGKGKTTAALGLALRAAGAGLMVFHNVELVLAGHKAPEGVIELADLVTEMKSVKIITKNGCRPVKESKVEKNNQE